MLWNREQYIGYMTFEGTGREFFCELFGPLIGLEEEWRAAGASAAECDLSAFGFDGVWYTGCPCSTGAITDIVPQVLEDTPSYTISRDGMGRLQKLCKGSATIPLPLEYPVKTPDDWRAVRHWYEFSERRVDREALMRLREQQRKGCLILAAIPGGFDEPRQLMGEEELCVALYEEPEMIGDMLSVMADTALRVFERVNDILTIDNLTVHEDMAGKSGPLVGPKQVREFILPYYRRVWDPLRAAGARLFSQDSDGDMTPVVEAFMDAGVNVMFPCEPAAGMDMTALRAKYGKRLAFKGGIDKFALRGEREDIRRELERKLSPAMRGGGTIFAVDHRIPNGVPIDNYRYYVRLAQEMLGLGTPPPAPFIRMAF